MVVVTGGAGFIGSCFLKKLNDEGVSDVLVVDYLGEANKWKNLVGKQFTDIIHPDVFREDLLDGDYMDDIEVIIHLGACSATTEKNADYLLDNNYRYSVDLAAYSASNDVRFIYASSAATYGIGEQGYSDTLSHTLRPLNMYGYSKLLFDNWILNNGLQESCVGIRYFNVFGPNEYHKSDMASMVYKAFCQIEQTGKIKLFKSNSPQYKDGEQKRDFVYVKDVCDVMWKLVKDTSIAGLFNLGTGNARNWNEVANAVFHAVGIEPRIEYIEMPDALKQQYQNYTEADMSKLAQTSAAHEFQTLESSVNDYVGEYLFTKKMYW
ncbi:MAG: ADP-glyceromanno-heptose 6-epimerase [Ignavibacteria bacterium]|nr:ADP-glyceromanno-heptose 6-epimerase [Ignavibacteria bacterium]